MTYKFLEDVAIADVAFEAEGNDLNELFESCALATFDTMVDLNTVTPDMEKEINLSNEELDKLLFEFLEELIYIKDSDYLVFSEFEIEIEKDNGYTLKAICHGANIDENKQELKADVKAVTFHMFEVKQEGKIWKARVVLDI